MQTQPRRRVAIAGALLAALAAVGGAGAAGGGGTIASPGFPNGTWIGTGVISSPTETVAGLTTRSSGKLSFTLTVSGGKVTGSGNWSYTQVGTGDIASRMVGVAPIRFSGTPTKPAFAGTMRITGDDAHHRRVRRLRQGAPLEQLHEAPDRRARRQEGGELQGDGRPHEHGLGHDGRLDGAPQGRHLRELVPASTTGPCSGGARPPA
jgi:hypothetical protein